MITMTVVSLPGVLSSVTFPPNRSGYVFDNGQPQARAANLSVSGTGGINLEEPLENPLGHLGWDTAASITHLHPQMVVFEPETSSDTQTLSTKKQRNANFMTTC